MKDERNDHELTVANLVDNDASDNDTETETSEPGTIDESDLKCGKVERPEPFREKAAPNRQADTGSEDRQKAGPE